jgi:hypothetical protein
MHFHQFHQVFVWLNDVKLVLNLFASYISVGVFRVQFLFFVFWVAFVVWGLDCLQGLAENVWKCLKMAESG